MKLRFTNFYIPFLMVLFVLFLGFSADPPDGNTGAPFDGICSNCHGGGNFDGVVMINGLPSSIMPSTTYTITVIATATMGSPIKGGFQLVCVDAANTNAGDLTSTNGETGTTFFNSREYIDHRGAKSYSANEVIWNFNWTSPSGPGGAVITMYCASNMANGDGSSGGDFIVNSSQSGTMASGGVPLSVMITSKKNVSCNGGSDGTATAAASGGTTPYTFNWSNGSTGTMATMLSAGTVTVTVTDNSSATAKVSTIITQPTVLNLLVSVVKNVTCNGGKDGSILAIASGGTTPYNIVYSSGSPNNLFAGTYTSTVTDANFCTSSNSVIVSQPDSFSINKEIFVDPTCPLDSNGQIKLSVSGATSPYQYKWSSGEVTNQIVKKKIGIYKVTITDIKNCTITRGYELKSVDLQPPILIAKNSKVYLNQLGKNIPKITDYIVQNTDDCDPSPKLAINIDTFRCNHLGKRNYIISSTDVSGNRALFTIEIEVLDTLKPIIHVWKDTTFKKCNAIVPTIIATDNCIVAEFKKISGPDAGTIFPIGKTVLSYSAKDVSGNQTMDSFRTEVISPLHLSIDSFYFNYCMGDTAFTLITLKHDLQLSMKFYYRKDTTKILQDTSFTVKTKQPDTIKFKITEESGCFIAFEKDTLFPGSALKLDSVKITNSSKNDNGKVEVFITGSADSIAWYDANTNIYINNTGLQLKASDYIIKAYKGPCLFVYGPYKVQLETVVSDDLKEFNVSVYPNPFTNEITMVSDFKSDLQYMLINTQGSIISRGEFNSQLTIDGTHLSSGIYFLRCFGMRKSNIVMLIKI
ncbi:MAG: choice-of-anchor V domain-containing protein [Saprospiraceae bacterium]